MSSRALDRVGGADPDELRDLASKVRAGNYADVSRELVEVVGRALDEEADSDEAGGAGPDAAIDDEAEPAGAMAIDEPAADDEAADDEAVPDEAASNEAVAPEEFVEASVAAAVAVSLGDLVQHWALDETDLERVLGAACSPTAASRLRRRHARQGRSRSAAGANQGVGC